MWRCQLLMPRKEARNAGISRPPLTAARHLASGKESLGASQISLRIAYWKIPCERWAEGSRQLPIAQQGTGAETDYCDCQNGREYKPRASESVTHEADRPVGHRVNGKTFAQTGNAENQQTGKYSYRKKRRRGEGRHYNIVSPIRCWITAIAAGKI